MPVSAGYRPDPAHPALGDAFLDPVTPARFPRHVLRYHNQRWAERVGLGELTPAECESPAAPLYAGPAFGAFRRRLEQYAARHPGRLALPYWQRAAPCALLIDDVEALWAAIAERDDWGPFEGKLAAIEELRSASDALV